MTEQQKATIKLTASEYCLDEQIVTDLYRMFGGCPKFYEELEKELLKPGYGE